MKRIKRIIAVLFVVVFAFSCFDLSVFAAKAKPAIEVKISADSEKGNKLQGSLVTVEVKNNSKKEVKNIVAVSSGADKLAVVGCNKGKKTISALKPGKSVKYSYIVFPARRTANGKSQALKKAMYYQHSILNASKFSTFSANSGKKVSAKQNFKFDDVSAKLTVTAYYGISEIEFAGAKNNITISFVPDITESVSSGLTTPLSNDTHSETYVYIFPNHGKKYHNELHNEGKYNLVTLEYAIDHGYTPCKDCYN